jgi:hypothetical protein
MAARQLGAPPDPRSEFDSPAWQGWLNLLWTFVNQGNYLVANLPSKNPLPGQTAYATNGRKVGEGAGAGTGVPVYFSNGAWRVYSTDAPVAS